MHTLDKLDKVISKGVYGYFSNVWKYQKFI